MSDNLKKWILFISLVFIWGSSFILIKRGLLAYNSSQIIAIRAFSAFLALSPLIIKHHQREIFKHWKPILAMGLLGVIIPGFLFAEAQRGINSATTSMINSLVPVFTVIVSIVFFSTKIKLINVIGILIGFAGAAGLLMINNDDHIGGSMQYMSYALLGAMFNGITVVITKQYLGTIKAIAATLWALIFVGPLAGIYLFNTDFLTILNTHPLGVESLLYVCVLGVSSTAIAIILFNTLIKLGTSVFAASVTYLIPAVAILWGTLDGEALAFGHIICIVTILTGVYLVNKKV